MHRAGAFPVPVGVAPRRFVRGTAVAVLGIFTPGDLEGLIRSYAVTLRPYPLRGAALPFRQKYITIYRRESQALFSKKFFYFFQKKC